MYIYLVYIMSHHILLQIYSTICIIPNYHLPQSMWLDIYTITKLEIKVYIGVDIFFYICIRLFHYTFISYFLCLNNVIKL